jgi:N-acetyl-S-(2-succino)cysteine monooxygenase
MVTKHVGLVCTGSTTYTEPYNLARQLTTLDHISRGRAGWNMVTSFSLDEARNFGLDKVLSSEQRHSRATEFIDVFTGLEKSWDDDALLRENLVGLPRIPSRYAA